ncbi:hypothetical protein FALBO_8094 [Fusarium albosuccineum]|uniref:Uncharacterized protein n=1 Tax=Fusarium albosuccineum TaxID=1237068 RepID=A0A8H4LBF8_9HYPO|nr:hypothetical protein FALBO_8094 [Fusarium albosuccineum]
MLDLMVSRTPDDSSHFRALCARVRGISAEIPTPEATPPPTTGSLTGPQNLPEPTVAPQDADRLQPSGNTAGSPGFPLQQRTEPGLQPTGSSLSEHEGIHQSDQSQPAPETAPDNQSQSATDTASGDQPTHGTGEPPGPKPPAKKPPPFGEARFAKLNSDLRKESEPNPSLLFGKAYDLCQALRGTSPAQEKIDPSDPWRQQLRTHITNLEAKKKDEDGRALYTTTAKRYRWYQFATEYEKDRTEMAKEDARKRAKQKRRKPQPKRPKAYTKPKEDHALVKLIRDCWGLHSSFVVTQDDWRRTKAVYLLATGWKTNAGIS